MSKDGVAFDEWLENITRTDGWENVLSGFGTSRDKRSANRIKIAPSGHQRENFLQIHASDDMGATLAELPAKEMFRKWITINVDEEESAPDESEDMRTEEPSRAPRKKKEKPVGERMLQRLEKLEAQRHCFEAKVWARVFGGGLMFLAVDDGHGGDLTKPLNMSGIKSFDFIKVFDRWDVHIEEVEDDISKKEFGDPRIYRLQSTSENGQITTPSIPIHASRFIRFDGVLTSRQRRARNSGWADSIYVRLEEPLADFGISWHGVANIIQDFAQGVFKMKGLARAIGGDKDKLVLSRLTTMDICRSSTRFIPIDSDSEEFVRQQTPVSGLPELMDRTSLRLASAARTPVTLLMGMSPAGLQATGDSDIRFFYDQISAAQEMEIRPQLERLITIVFNSKDGPTAGIEPENWSFEFNPLWQLSDKEQAQVRKLQMETDTGYTKERVLSADEVANSRFGGDRYSTNTVLDTEKRAEEAANQEQAGEPEPPEVVSPGSPVGRVNLSDDVVQLSTIDQDDDSGVCDPRSPNYSPRKCRELRRRRRARGDEARMDVIEKRGDAYVVLSSDRAKVLGEHATRGAAERQLRAIEASKRSKGA
ncbi:MAG: DUF1073 domain-containing protein [Gammaproteobacteria bacterium]|nr:DUF1073 domain-containing protein [Gammaproteobacteria bacterium]